LGRITSRATAGSRAATVLALVLAGCGGGGGAKPQTSRVPSPSPTTDARWEGRWEFNYTLTELRGVSEASSSFKIGDKIRRIWEVTPGCDKGACNVEINATNPDDPAGLPVQSVATLGSGSYTITQDFPASQTVTCKGADGKAVTAKFDAGNTVVATPSKFDDSKGGRRVTELVATKTTTFRPTGAAVAAGGECVEQGAIWRGTVSPIS
jgi:hypothetical protein